ncbi:MAG: Ca-activated chloride channel family protein [Myxococcota bacterium]|jgi:Ca-activated chloride channel family protein
MSLAQPFWLLALVSVALLAGVVVGAGTWHRQALGQVFGATMLARVLPRSVRVRRTTRDVLALVGLAAIVVALVEPRFGKQLQRVESRGTNIVVALDLSRSMDATDVDPSRLVRAKRELHDLVRVLEGDRLGLVLYAGGAYPRLPLTADHAAVLTVVDDVSTRSFQAQGSSLGAALRSARGLLDNADDSAGQAILVLSDGEAHDAEDAMLAAEECAALGIVVYGVGIGESAAPIPLPDGRFLEENGETVMSEPRFDTLKEVARITGGAFVQSVPSSDDVVGLYRGEMRRTLQAVVRRSEQREVWRTAYQWPLAFGVLCWLVGAWIGDGRGRRWGAAAVILVLLGGVHTPVAHAADPLVEADRLYRNGDYVAAARRLTELALHQPGDASLLDRIGAARYRASDFEGAARAFDEASRIRGGSDVETLYNSANAHYQAGRLEDAASRYERILERAPEFSPAKTNHDLVVQEIEARRAAKPPPPPPPEPSEQPGDQGGGEGEEAPPEGGGEGGESEGPSDGEGSSEADDPGAGDPGEPGETPEGEINEGDVSQSEPTDGEPGDAEGGGAGGAATETSGSITEGEAHRLLDGIEEGSHKMVIRGQGDSHPW